MSYRLKEGRQYELKYSHYVPALEGANTTIREIIVEPKFTNQNLEINTAEAMLIGNYGAQSLLLGARSPTNIWHNLSLVPKEKILRSQQKGIDINTHGMQLPIAVSWSLRRWFWRRSLPVVILFLAFAMLGTANIIDRNLSKFLDGTLTWSQIAENWPIILIVVIGSGLASLVIPILQGRTNAK